MTFKYYIAIKNDYSQYQKVISATIIRKAFDNYDKKFTTSFLNYIPIIDKFVLKRLINYIIIAKLVDHYLFAIC